MGAAKQRGSFEQRQKDAIVRREEAITDLREHVEKLDRMDKEAEEMKNAQAKQFIQHYLKYNDRGDAQGVYAS